MRTEDQIFEEFCYIKLWMSPIDVDDKTKLELKDTFSYQSFALGIRWNEFVNEIMDAIPFINKIWRLHK